MARSQAAEAASICSGWPSLITSQKFIAEFVGTYMLVFFGSGSAFIVHLGSITLIGDALTWGCVVAAIVYSIGHISGSHINPASTIAFAVVGLFPWKQVPLYVTAQILGSIFASLTLRWLFGSNLAHLMLTLPVGPDPYSDVRVMAWEIITTFVLLFVICSTVLDPRAAKGLGGIAIGGAVYINVIMAGPISGCSMNPARSFGPALVNHNFHKFWIYVISPIIGAIIGTSLYYFLQISKEIAKKVDISPDHVNPTHFEQSMDIP